MIGLKILSNPTVVDMDNYLQNGQVAAWPFLQVLNEMVYALNALSMQVSQNSTND
jgi:hypothetical protein